MRYQFPNTGVCSSQVSFDLNDGIVTNVKFTGGCNGNTQGVAKLAEGMPIDVLIERLQGIRCGMRPTSCPDQLARALIKAKQNG